MVLAVNIHDNATYPSSPSNQSISTSDAAQQLERLLNQMEDVSERPPGWLADEVAGKSSAAHSAAPHPPSSTDGQRSPDALKLRSGGGRNPNAAQQRVPPAIGRPSCRATVPTRPGHSHSIKPGFSMIPESPTEEGREGRDEDENGARAEEDGEESCGSCGSMDDEESAKPPVPTSFSAKPNPMMDYVPQYNLCKKDSKVKEGKKKKKKKDGVHGGGEKIDVDQALEHYYEMEKLLPGETPPIITMSSSASTETLEPVDLAQLKTVLDSEPQSEIDSMYAQIIEGIREEIEDFEAAENREDKVDMLLQCYGSFAGDSTLASDIDDDTIATEKDVPTTRTKTKSFDASSKASSSGRSRFSVPSSFSKVTRAIKLGRPNRRASTDSPKSSKMASSGLPPPGRSKAPISSKAARAEGLYKKSQQPMNKKSDSCHSDSCEPVVIVPSLDEDSLQVQLNRSQNEEKSLLFVEIGHDLANDDEPTVPGRQTYFLPGTSKDEIEGPPNAGLPAVAEEEITEDKTETPSKGGAGGSDKGAAENAGKPSELPSDADIAVKKKKRDLSKGFEVVRIRTGKEKIRPSTRTKKYVALSKKLELEENEQTKAEKEAEKARKEAEKEAEKARKLADKKAEKIRKEAEKKEKEKKKLRETARMDEERFAARQQKGARNDVANYNAPTPKRGNKSAKPYSPRFKSESSNESVPKVDRAKTRDKASKGEAPAKVSFNDKKSPKNQKNTSHASGKGVKPKKTSKQRGRTQKRSLAPVIETASSESSSAENRPTANVEKAPSHRRFKSPLRLKKFTAGEEAEEGDQGKVGKQVTPTPSPRNAKSPKKQGMRSNIADRKKKSEASKPDEPKSKTQSVSRSPSGYIPLAERAIRFSSTADEFEDESSSSSDEDDVRDEYESPRRGQSGRGSRRLIERDITFETVDSRYESFGGDSRYESFGGDSYDGEAFPVSIFDDVIDSLGRRLIGDDGDYELRRGRRNSIGRTVSSSSYIDGYAM